MDENKIGKKYGPIWSSIATIDEASERLKTSIDFASKLDRKDKEDSSKKQISNATIALDDLLKEANLLKSKLNIINSNLK
jgi:hypothetical protein